MHWTVASYNCIGVGASPYMGSCACECRNSETGRITMIGDYPTYSLYSETAGYYDWMGCQDTDWGDAGGDVSDFNYNDSKCQPVCNNACNQQGHSRRMDLPTSTGNLPRRSSRSNVGRMGRYRKGGSIGGRRTQRNPKGNPKK